jgi:hypothetical protein
MKRLDRTTTTRSGMRSSSPAHQRASNCAEIAPSAAPTAARPLSGHNAAAKVAIPSMKARRRVAYPKLMVTSTYDGVITSRDLRAAEWGSGVSLRTAIRNRSCPLCAKSGHWPCLTGHRIRPRIFDGGSRKGSKGNAVRASSRYAQCRGCPRNCKRRVSGRFCH